MSESSSCIIVVSNIDGKKYKMVMNGDLSQLAIGKVKRYLQSATGMEPSAQTLRFNGHIVPEGATGAELGLFDGAVLFLDAVGGGGGLPSPATPLHQSVGSHGGRGPPPPPASSSTIAAYEQDRWLELERAKEIEERRQESDRQERERRQAEEQLMREHELRAAAEVERLRVERERQRQYAEEMARKRSEEERAMLARRQAESEERERAERQAFVDVTVRQQQHEINELKQAILRLEQQQQHVPSYYEPQPLPPAPTAAQGGHSGAAASGFYGGHSGASHAISRHYGGASASPPSLRGAPAGGVPLTPSERLGNNLRSLALFFGLESCELDANNTCIINLQPSNNNNHRGGFSDDQTTSSQRSLLLTFDPVTERLYLYSTLANTIPNEPTQRLRLFEMLLEGAVLGRDMAGGGVGVSTKSNLILLSTSLDMRHCDDEAAIAIADTFLEAVDRWSAAVDNVVGDLRDHYVQEHYDSGASHHHYNTSSGYQQQHPTTQQQPTAYAPSSSTSTTARPAASHASTSYQQSSHSTSAYGNATTAPPVNNASQPPLHHHAPPPPPSALPAAAPPHQNVSGSYQPPQRPPTTGPPAAPPPTSPPAGVPPPSVAPRGAAVAPPSSRGIPSPATRTAPIPPPNRGVPATPPPAPSGGPPPTSSKYQGVGGSAPTTPAANNQW